MDYLGLITLGFSAVWFIFGVWVCAHIKDREREKEWVKDADEFKRLTADRDKWRRKAQEATAMAEWLALHGHIKCPPSQGFTSNCRTDELNYPNNICQACRLKAADDAVKEVDE